MTGSLVISVAGRDKGRYYVAVEEKQDFVYLCDGKAKPLSKPKRKRLKHISCVGHRADPELARRLRTGARVTDEEIKYEIRQYRKSLL